MDDYSIDSIPRDVRWPILATPAAYDKAIDVVRILVGDETQIDIDGEYGLMVKAIAQALTAAHAQGWAEGAVVVEAAKDLYHKLIADTLPERLGLSALLDDYMAGEISALGDALAAARSESEK